MRIGYDKWGLGGELSAPIAVQEGRPLEIEVSVGALYGADLFPVETVGSDALKLLRSTILVRVDGRVVLRQASESFPAGPQQVHVGLNPIGASTCAEFFSGKIARIEFLGAAKLR